MLALEHHDRKSRQVVRPVRDNCGKNCAAVIPRSRVRTDIRCPSRAIPSHLAAVQLAEEGICPLAKVIEPSRPHVPLWAGAACDPFEKHWHRQSDALDGNARLGGARLRSASQTCCGNGIAVLILRIVIRLQRFGQAWRSIRMAHKPCPPLQQSATERKIENRRMLATSPIPPTPPRSQLLPTSGYARSINPNRG